MGSQSLLFVARSGTGAGAGNNDRVLMEDLSAKEGVWFVYDGDCPICSHAAHALRIKQKFGALSVLNARQADPADPLIREINRRGLDIDEGMVIYCNGRFHHGKAALKFMARHGAAKGGMNLSFKALFWSDRLSALLYPWMRGARNWLIRRRGIGRIDNLRKRNTPLFRPVFGDAWDDLPPVMKKRYANRPYTDDVVTVEGRLDVTCAGPIRALRPLFLVFGTVPPFSQDAVPVTVRFKSDRNSQAYHFHRLFRFQGRKPYPFRSRMVRIRDNEVVEIMRFGIGWRMRLVWENGRVILKPRGFVLSWFGHFMPLPIGFLMGRGQAEEIPVDDDHFDMVAEMIHPLWGRFYQYRGRFRVL